MKKYFLVFKLALQDLFEYKLDFFMSTFKYSLMVILMTFVWLQVEKDGQAGFFNPQETVSYFLMSAMLYSLSNFHPWYIEDDIRLGYLSKYLVKPISVNLYYFFYESARVTIDTLLKIVVFMIILFFFQLLPSQSFTRILVIFTYLPFIFLFSFQWLSLISITSFWITEAYALRWAVTIMTRLLSGILVPIVYFPEVLQHLFFFLPFEHLAFTPIQFILNKIDISTLYQSLAILICWIIVLGFFRQWIWQKGLHDFEGTGL